MILLADRGCVDEAFLHSARTHLWHIRLRLKGHTMVHLPHRNPCQVKALCPPLGHAHFHHYIARLGTAISPLHLALALPEDLPDDPCYVGSSEPTDLHTRDEYGLRFDSEETFLDEKSGGFQSESCELATTDAIERLVLILAIATLHFTSIGLYSFMMKMICYETIRLSHQADLLAQTYHFFAERVLGVVQAKVRRLVDTHWDRGLSSFKIGWRWFRQCYQRGWLRFAPFWLDPTPDTEPVIPLRRFADCVKRQWIVSLRCSLYAVPLLAERCVVFTLRFIPSRGKQTVSRTA